jgi:hypothetical protein
MQRGFDEILESWQLAKCSWQKNCQLPFAHCQLKVCDIITLTLQY